MAKQKQNRGMWVSAVLWWSFLATCMTSWIPCPEGEQQTPQKGFKQTSKQTNEQTNNETRNAFHMMQCFKMAWLHLGGVGGYAKRLGGWETCSGKSRRKFLGKKGQGCQKNWGEGPKRKLGGQQNRARKKLCPAFDLPMPRAAAICLATLGPVEQHIKMVDNLKPVPSVKTKGCFDLATVDTATGPHVFLSTHSKSFGILQ